MATSGLSNGAGHSLAPSETLYCSNLPDKLQKDDLKRALYMLMITYGPILDVVALKTQKMRGQAHVLFRDKDASTQALRALQNYDFFGKPMKLSYAKSKSDTLAKLDGTYKQSDPAASRQITTTTAQQIAFGGAPGATSTNGTALPPPPGLGVPPSGAVEDTSSASGRGAKRPREESEGEEDDGDAPMDESEDEDAPMDESDGD